MKRRWTPVKARRCRRSTSFNERFVAFGSLHALIRHVALQRGRVRRRPSAAVVLAAVLASTACSSAYRATVPTSTTTGRSGSSVAASTDSSDGTPSSNVAETATDASTEGRDADLHAAVRAFWDLYLELGARTGPFDGVATRERLATRTTGAELNRLLAYFSSNAASGYEVRGAIEIAPRIISANGSTAQVRDCYDDTTGLYRTLDNSRVDTDNPLRHQVLMSLEDEDGVWKVAAISDEGDGCHV